MNDQVAVTIDNFVRAEIDQMMFDLMQARAASTVAPQSCSDPVRQQTVVRMNRDTLYSFAVVDLAEGAELTIPGGGDRYASLMVVNQDHYINRVFRDRWRASVVDGRLRHSLCPAGDAGVRRSERSR